MSEEMAAKKAYADMASRLRDTVELLNKEVDLGFGGKKAGLKEAIVLILLDVSYAEMMAEEPLEEGDE